MKNNFKIKNLLFVILGSVIFSLGINLFIVPTGVFITGLLGLAQEISTVLSLMFNTPDISSLLYFALNIPIILLGWVKVGKRFTLRTLVATIIISFLTSVITVDTLIIEDKLLSILAGSIIAGSGVGITLKNGGSTGGADIIAMYLSLFKGKSFGVYNLLFNSIIIIIAIMLEGDMTVGLYMIISLYVTGLIIDKIHNYNEKSTLFIITYEMDVVREALLNNSNRGLTIIDSCGGFHKEQNNIIMVTTRKNDLMSTIKCIRNADPKSFVNVYKADTVYGNFENDYLKLL